MCEKYSWATLVKQSIFKLGFGYTRSYQHVGNEMCIKNELKVRLQEFSSRELNIT